MAVIGVRSLRQVVAHLRGEEIPEAPPVEPLASASLLSWRGDHRIDDLDMADVLGHGRRPLRPRGRPPPAATT